jgi:DNA-binding phage protein
MSKKGKNWRETVSNAILLRILDIIDGRENGSAAQFYKKTGISSGAFCTCLRRDSTPKIEMLMAVRSAYSVSLDWLVCGDSAVVVATTAANASTSYLQGRIEELQAKVGEYVAREQQLLKIIGLGRERESVATV